MKYKKQYYEKDEANNVSVVFANYGNFFFFLKNKLKVALFLKFYFHYFESHF